MITALFLNFGCCFMYANLNYGNYSQFYYYRLILTNLQCFFNINEVFNIILFLFFISLNIFYEKLMYIFILNYFNGFE